MVNIRMMLAGEGKRGGRRGKGQRACRAARRAGSSPAGGKGSATRRVQPHHSPGRASCCVGSASTTRWLQKAHRAHATRSASHLPPVSRTQLQILKNRNSTRGASPKSQDIRRGEAYSVPQPLWLGFPLFRGRSLRSSLTLRPVPLGVTFGNARGGDHHAHHRPPHLPGSSAAPTGQSGTHGFGVSSKAAPRVPPGGPGEGRVTAGTRRPGRAGKRRRYYNWN